MLCIAYGWERDNVKGVVKKAGKIGCSGIAVDNIEGIIGADCGIKGRRTITA